MERREKLYARVKKNPKHVSFQQLDNLLRAYGFQSRNPGGSHYVYVNGPYRITVPYRRPHVGEVYVKKALRIIDQLKAQL
jgi:predicted RNA binding protein YcfA (HicA-like mRNA interferase family)